MNIQEIEMFIECDMHLLKFFKDDFIKVAAWWSASNPFFGEIPPLMMFYIGRGRKVLEFIKNKGLENGN